MPTPLPIIIEAVQFTPDCEPVIVQYTATTGPLARTNLFHTTQTALGGDAWGDDDIKTALLAHLMENGIDATITPNPAGVP